MIAVAATWVLHVDLDQFIAAVEMLRRPELVGLPVVVGGRGDPTERGVVATASYAARESGVGSGMPLRIAGRKLAGRPDAVFLPVDKPAYDAASAEVMATLRGLQWGGAPVAVQVLGWDEAFVGPSPEADPSAPVDPMVWADALRVEVLEATGLHCSVGVGDTTLRAKIATGFAKPQGTFQLTRDNWAEVMGERPTRELWGIGAKTTAKLSALGVETVTQLGEADDVQLAEAFGPNTGPWLARVGRGWGQTTVDPTPWVPRAHGREETFQDDLIEPSEIDAALAVLVQRALDDIVAEGRAAARVAIKVRFKPFFTYSRSLTLPQPTFDSAPLTEAARTLLRRLDDDRPVRLLGVRLEMVPPEGGY